MKKIRWISLSLFLFTSALISFHANSQSFVLKDVTNMIVNNGDTIIVTGSDTMLLEVPILVENNSASTKVVQVMRSDLNVVPGAYCFMMWGIMEYLPATVVTVYGVSINPATTDSSFMSAYQSNGVEGTSWYKFIFFDENNPADSAWAVVQYNALGIAGIQSRELDDVSLFPNPGNGFFNLKFQTRSKSDLSAEVFNSIGDLVVEEKIEQGVSQYLLNMQDWPAGIYFLKISGKENNFSKTWKLVKM